LIAVFGGKIPDEVNHQTAEWILSKPVSRTAFVIGKAKGFALNFLLCSIIFQFITSYIHISIRAGYPVNVLPYFFSFGLILLIFFFYLSLILFWGIITMNKASAIGLSVFTWILLPIIDQLLFPITVKIGSIAGVSYSENTSLQSFLEMLLPNNLNDILKAITAGSSIVQIPYFWLPFVTVFILSSLFLFVSLNVFSKRQF
jgi:ABC-type transport system involved in multi-copper enzyme maturation permease subunit